MAPGRPQPCHVLRAAVLVLEHNGYKVHYPSPSAPGDDGLTCCSLPNIDGGDIAPAIVKIEQNVAALLPCVRAGRKVVVPGPSCGMMIKDGVFFPATGAPSVGAVPGRTTAVHYFKVTLSPGAKDALQKRAAKDALVVKHSAHRARAELSRAALDKLAADLASA